MHAAAGILRERLGHERGVDALLDRDLLHDGAEGHDVVGGGEGVGVPQVDLVLAGAGLVVAELHRDAQVFEHAHRAAPEVVRRAAGNVVEVAGRVDRLRPVFAVLRRAKQVELDLGVRVERESAIGCALERALEHVAGVGDCRHAIGGGDVAEHAPGRVDVATPRQRLERRRVGVREQVGFEGAAEALDGGAVEADALGEGALDLGRRDRHRFQGADDVGEPEPDELDAPLLDRAKNEVTLLIHPHPLSQFSAYWLGHVGSAGHGCPVCKDWPHVRRAPDLSIRQLLRSRAEPLRRCLCAGRPEARSHAALPECQARRHQDHGADQLRPAHGAHLRRCGHRLPPRRRLRGQQRVRPRDDASGDRRRAHPARTCGRRRGRRGRSSSPTCRSAPTRTAPRTRCTPPFDS